MVQFETTSFSFFWIGDILLTLLFCQRQQFFGAFSGSFGDVFAAQKSCDFIYVSFSFVNIIGNSMIKENWKRGDISAKNAGISPLYFLCIMWWRDWHPTKSAHQSVQTTISAHQILSHHLVQIPISIYNAEDMIYNSDTDTSFMLNPRNRRRNRIVCFYFRKFEYFRYIDKLPL